jgi:2,4-dienoyl-CoA reductase-like NADH-dependent reductase (Old Yellow Enzyme family)
MPSLFDPLQLGPYRLANRVIMAPLTRSRSGAARIPNAMMAEYYRQRASAGLIITEATAVTPMGVGYADTPGIWSDEQVAGWRLVTDAVHEKGGRIFLQLWHVGRVSDPMFLNGALPVSSSAVQPAGHVSLVRPQRPYVTPRALELYEIPPIIEAYRAGAHNAKRAGFDGVELHGANGYLPDQFLEDGVNQRTDQYGGPIENRARFMLEALDAAISVWGADRVGLHLSPGGGAHDIRDSNPAATFAYVAEQAGKRGIAFICAREAKKPGWLGPQLKQVFGGVYIANEGFGKEEAEAVLAAGEADAVAFGKSFIANPDLVQRFQADSGLNTPHPETFYQGGPGGYIDYPKSELTLA